MFGVIVSHGKTVEEALLNAAEQLKVTREEIDYEVIDRGHRGLLWRRPAVIQAKVKPQLKHEREEDSFDIYPNDSQASIHEDHISNGTLDETIPEGVIWVKDGRIFCKNSRFHFPLLTPCDGITVLVNGKPVDGTTIVSEEDTIDVDLHEEIVDSKISITISEDKMQAMLEVVPGYAIFRHLKDQKPKRELTLEIIETKIFKEEIKEYMVIQELKRLGIEYGVNYEEIERACKLQEVVTCVIANGTPPQEGEDGVFELYQDKFQEEKDQFKITDSVDWKERFSLPNVKTGEVIGSSLPAKPGISGWNVLGEEIPAPDVTELTIETGEGTSLYGPKVVATNPGRIKIQKKRNNTLHFSVMPQYVHNGNVNLQTGNIHFKGDVIILGNVEEGMSIDSGGNLHITGNVTNATIRTGGDVVINGPVIQSEIICGHSSLFWDNMLSCFKAIYEDLEKLIVVAKQLQTNRSFSNSDISMKGLQPMLLLLTESKFKELPARIRKISASLNEEKESPDTDTVQIIDFLEKAFLYYHPLISNLKQLETLLTYMETIITSVEYDSDKKINIQAQSLTTSSIKSAWDVVIERFTYGSNIYCKGGFRVDGILRGGHVHADKFVEASLIGSHGGSRTTINIANRTGYLKAIQIFPDTFIKIDNIANKIVTQETSVYAKLSNRNTLELR